VDWLLHGWIAKGDLTVLDGLGGLGKSWVTMALALAVIRGDTTCLDQSVEATGSVLYVDEENPQDVVYSRMLRLGLDPTRDAGRLRYLWNQGVRLDRDAEPLLDEVLDMRPTLFVLDSLTRLHSKDENASGEIGALLNDAVKPLARESGAGVVLIHHHNKNGTTRGSTDIVNAADAVIGVYPHGGENSNQFRMRLNKSRRRPAGAEIIVGIQDHPTDGSVSLLASPPVINPIF
jgi:RecA-family ATPase